MKTPCPPREAGEGNNLFWGILGLPVHGRGWVRPCCGEVPPVPPAPQCLSARAHEGSPPVLPQWLRDAAPTWEQEWAAHTSSTMLDWKGKAYLAGTQGRPQMWSGGCWRHHRNEQSGLLSQRNLYLSTLRLRTRKKVLAAPGICSNSRQLNITLFWLYCLLKTKEKLICR